MAKKTILITGSTDGIGFETAKRLIAEGHHVLLHGRNPKKLEGAQQEVASVGESCGGSAEAYVADLTDMNAVEALAKDITEKHESLDVIINNAGIFKTSNPTLENGHDVRFLVNTIAPYLLTKRLLPILKPYSRVINVSSAAQAPVDLRALAGKGRMPHGVAYSQSKLAITMWTREMALEHKETGPIFIAINPASFLGTKMVKEGYGVDGNDIGIGADILRRAALSKDFGQRANGKYFDNDQGRFAPPHPDGLDSDMAKDVIRVMESVIEEMISTPSSSTTE